MTAAAAPSRVRGELRPARPVAAWTIAFILVPMVCQLLILTPGLGSLRVPLRSISYISGAVFLMIVPGQARWHPAGPAMLLSLFIVFLAFFNPTTNNTLAGIAHVLFYLSIASPLFWVSRMRLTGRDFRDIIIALWGFQTLSAFVAALQVYFPGSFQAQVSQAIDDSFIDSLSVKLADGTSILRPMGLTDLPGGGCTAGFYAILFSVSLFSSTRGLLRMLTVLSMGIGAFTLYLCQVRSTVVMLVVCLFVMGVMFVWLGRAGRALSTFCLVGVAASVAFVLALQIGGEHTFDRLLTLVDDESATVYQRNRGQFLEVAFTELLPLFPLGAGLGRTGMISTYFADRTDPDKFPIYSEIQWSTWIVDGGFPLTLCYSLAILVATGFIFRVLSRRSVLVWVGLQEWGVLLLAYNLGAVALTFNTTVFGTPLGQEFWLLNTAFFTAACTAQEDATS